MIDTNERSFMTLNDFQKTAVKTEMMKRDATLSANDPAIIAKVLGLVGEAGEVAEKFKKIVRDKNGEITNENIIELTKELGDVLWYVAALADYLSVELDEVAERNIQKVADRKARGVQAGSGDNR